MFNKTPFCRSLNRKSRFLCQIRSLTRVRLLRYILITAQAEQTNRDRARVSPPSPPSPPPRRSFSPNYARCGAAAAEKGQWSIMRSIPGFSWPEWSQNPGNCNILGTCTFNSRIFLATNISKSAEKGEWSIIRMTGFHKSEQNMAFFLGFLLAIVAWIQQHQLLSQK